MTDQPATPKTLDALHATALHQEDSAALEFWRDRAISLNVEVQIRDQQLAEQRGIIAALEARLNDTLADDNAPDDGRAPDTITP